jgi:hypothetical protein
MDRMTSTCNLLHGLGGTPDALHREAYKEYFLTRQKSTIVDVDDGIVYVDAGIRKTAWFDGERKIKLAVIAKRIIKVARDICKFKTIHVENARKEERAVRR